MTPQTEKTLETPGAAGTVYGPVTSWRLGRSLGVDLLGVDSICSFACVYCQLGRINRLTTARAEFVPTARVLADLAESDWRAADVVTFSGSGEPTLAANLGAAIDGARLLTARPIVVLTNSTLLSRPEVREEIGRADRVFCKLDAWSDETLRRFDRPHPDVQLEAIISGIAALRRQFRGFLAVQTMILRAPTEFELEKMAAILRLVRPDELQLNLPTRPVPPRHFVAARGNELAPEADFRRLKTIARAEFEALGRRLARLAGVPVTAR